MLILYETRLWQEGDLSGEFKGRVAEHARFWERITCGIYDRFARNDVARPGLTGLHQALGRRDVSPEHRVMLDLFYEKNASLGMDIAILIATIPAVLTAKGAR
ncbi:MAG: UDP-phosphate galactose phosphotransferase [Microgenomates group bacterium Gr01-1014_7]|nr:MAG: UDP-phosphate galactose phosphotransferase [Microgenomates group bacterium Gr01-1014_7]